MEKRITMRKKYGPAMDITDQAEADAYFEQCVQHMMSFGKDRAEAERIERTNLGYYAGYYGNGTRERVERLFRCAHPVFGKIAESGPPTPEEAFAAGAAMAKAAPPPKQETVMSEHTPAPWEPRGAAVTTANDGDIIAVIRSVGPGNNNYEANARLIAAAPDLLEVCRSAMIILEQQLAPIQLGNEMAEAIAKAAPPQPTEGG